MESENGGSVESCRDKGTMPGNISTRMHPARHHTDASRALLLYKSTHDCATRVWHGACF